MEEKECARCGGTFGCGAGDRQGCWCGSVRLDPECLEAMAARWSGCLCPACLEELAAGFQALPGAEE